MRLFRLLLPLTLAAVFLVVLFNALAPAPALARQNPRGQVTAGRVSPLAPAAALNVDWVGQVGGPNYAVAMQGPYAYVGMGPSLLILNITSLATPTVVGQVLVPDIVRGVSVSGTYAYIVAGAEGLRVINVANPAAPVEVGVYNTPGTALGVAVSGTYAYVADQLNGLRVVSVATPTTPVEVGFYDTPDLAEDVAVSGTLAYVADSSSGVRVVNVATPTAPVEIGFYNTLGSARGVRVSGALAYVADGGSGLRILNVTNPTSPTLVGFYDTPDLADDVVVSGTLAYVADEASGLHVISVATPTAPVALGVYDSPGTAFGVALRGAYAFVADNKSGLRVVNVATPTLPAEVGAYASFAGAWGISLDGSYAYVADNAAGLRVVNVATPTAPAEVGFYDSPDIAQDGVVSGNYAYVVDTNAGLRVVNVANPATPVEVGFYDTPGQAYGLALRGNYVYVADDGSGLRVVNVATPTAPVEVGFYDTFGIAYGVSVSGTYAYVADGANGLRVINVANPAAPVEVGFYNTPGNATGVSVRGTYAYVADGANGLRVVNVATPTAPVEVGFYDTPGTAYGVSVRGQLVYVADGSAGLRVVNVANPAAPVEVGFYDTPSNAYNVGVSGPYAYVADFVSGLLVLRYPSAAPCATEYTGDDLTDFSSVDAQAVRDAVNAVPAGGVVKVAGTCVGVQAQGGTTQTVLITKTLTLIGGYVSTDWTTSNPLANPTTLDAQGGGRVFLIGAPATLRGLIVSNGYISPGTFWGGAGIYATQGLTLTEMQIYSNTLNCGTVYCAGGGAVIQGDAWISGTTFANNLATVPSAGGGLWATVNVYITNTTFQNNTSMDAGGAYLSIATLRNVNFIGNTGYNGGGAWFFQANLQNTTFLSNTALNEAGGALFQSTTYITGTTFRGNQAQIIYGGAATFYGAANVTNTAFVNNAAPIGGGATFYNAAARRFVNTLWAGNRASGDGAALYVYNANPLSLLHTTIVSPTTANNQAVYVAGGTVALTNTLIASHTVGIGRAGGAVTEDYSLFAGVTTPYTGVITTGVHSLIGPAGFYNHTSYTLTAASYALDAATNAGVTSDYFGNPRPLGRGADIGYAESAYSFPIALTLTAQPAHLFANGLDESLLTITATRGNGASVSGQLVTLTAPSGIVAPAAVPFNINGVATTTYTAGLVPGTTSLTATVNEMGNVSVATTVVTLKPNPLIGMLAAQFGGQTITYTLVVTNIEALTQTVNMSGSVPTGASLINVVGGVSVNTGGDYGYGYADASNINLGPNQSHTLQWTIQFVGFTGDVVTQGHAESTTARLRLPAALQIFRILFMPVYK